MRVKGMRLKDYLNTLDHETIVAIGGNDGSSFMYIGRAGDLELIDKEFEKYLDKQKELMQKCMVRMTNLLSTKLTKKKGQYDRYEVLDMADNISTARTSYCTAEKYVVGYLPVLERRIKKHFDRDMIDGSIGIVVTGAEKGDYWFKDEFDKDHSVG